MIATAAWAVAEARFPDRVRMLFSEDLIMQPDVALRGLGRFLDVPVISDHTDRVIALVKELIEEERYSRAVLMAGTEVSLPMPKLINEMFERRLATLPETLQEAWEDHARLWLQSPNRRIVSLAQVPRTKFNTDLDFGEL